MIPERMTVRLGPLREALAAACLRSGLSPSEEIRRRLAASLGVPAPDMPRGNPDPASAARARWGKKQKRPIVGHSVAKRVRKDQK